MAVAVAAAAAVAMAVVMGVVVAVAEAVALSFAVPVAVAMAGAMACLLWSGPRRLVQVQGVQWWHWSTERYRTDCKTCSCLRYDVLQ